MHSELEMLNTHCSDMGLESWRILRIQAEIVDAFESLRTIKKAVAIFGSARTESSNTYYQACFNLAEKLSKRGIDVITGGGPGIMQAANQGAKAGKKGLSIGLNIELPKEQIPNPYQDIELEFRYFFVRKLCFVKYSQAYVIFPGGYGSLDELFDVVTLMQTGKISKKQIILYSSEFWNDFILWIKNKLLKEGMLDQADIDLIKLCDDIDEIVELVAN